ncbi:hypothetical protein E2C01_038851 [Portunus trituberculatus]|uniref:Uncharacterized protein n=1 Tax=Portunus trituberculatus TaxID=210409 RepID=A0A5B7FJ47_PORTR|nr:hypothetical protein [Portunus trituberculatus]
MSGQQWWVCGTTSNTSQHFCGGVLLALQHSVQNLQVFREAVVGGVDTIPGHNHWWVKSYEYSNSPQHFQDFHEFLQDKSASGTTQEYPDSDAATHASSQPSSACDSFMTQDLRDVGEQRGASRPRMISVILPVLQQIRRDGAVV